MHVIAEAASEKPSEKLVFFQTLEYLQLTLARLQYLV